MSLSAAQLEIMKVVWGFGAATVRDVYEALRTRRTIADRTVMTMMKMMEAKGALEKASRRADACLSGSGTATPGRSPDHC